MKLLIVKYSEGDLVYSFRGHDIEYFVVVGQENDYLELSNGLNKHVATEEDIRLICKYTEREDVKHSSKLYNLQDVEVGDVVKKLRGHKQKWFVVKEVKDEGIWIENGYVRITATMGELQLICKAKDRMDNNVK